MAINRRYIHAIFALLFLVAAVRLYLVWRERHAGEAPAKTESAPPLNPDYYVMPKKLHAYDVKSASALTKQPVWVKEGYRYYYYPYDAAHHRTDFAHEAGLLGPIEKVEFKDIEAEAIPNGKGAKAIMGDFEKDGKSYAVEIGRIIGGENDIWIDEQFYIQDPHELYKHWPKDVWDAIAQHQVKNGMNELQADFALGYGTPEKQDDPNVKTVHYPNGGKKVAVTFRDGKASEIKPE